MEIRCEGGLTTQLFGQIEAPRRGLVFRQKTPVESEGLVVCKALEEGGLGASMIRLQFESLEQEELL